MTISKPITTPLTTTSLRLELHNGMFDGWVAFDDVSLKQVGSSTNLVADPSFDNATSGWSAAPGTDFPGTMVWKGTWGPGQPRTGTYSYVLSIWMDGYWQPRKVAARAGEQYDLYAYLRGSLDPDSTYGSFVIRANFYDSNNSYLSSSTISLLNPGSLATWTRRGGRVTAPANAASMEVQFFVTMGSGWVNIDDVEVTIVPPNAATEVTKYYMFGGQRVAMRKNGVLTYLHSDHLGSTVLETNITGTVTSDEKYLAYGKQRDSGKVVTDHRFTGQKEDASGLQYFNARFYDPVVGMFVSPDTIVPDAGNVFDYNRYMYVRGRVMSAIDPSGHSCMLVNGSIECRPDQVGGVTLTSDVQIAYAPPTPKGETMSSGDGCIYGCSTGVLLNYTKPSEAYGVQETSIPVPGTFDVDSPPIVPLVGQISIEHQVVQVVTTKNTIAIQHKSSGMVGFGPAVGVEYVHDDGSFSPVVGFQAGDVDASAQLWNGNYQVMIGAGDISEGIAGNLPQYLTFATTGQKLQELGGLNGFRDTYAQGYELTSAQYFYGTDKYTGVQQMYFYLNFYQMKHESRK